ncbi:MAG TPA: hypothetical protein VGE35_00030 [Candidatus Paceibacterota bacterium]
MFSHIFLFTCQLISAVFRITSSEWRPGSENAASARDYFSLIGPRMLMVRDETVVRLTGVFTVIALFDESGKLISCRPAYFMQKRGDTVIFGPRVQTEYRRLDALNFGYPQSGME